MADNSTWKQRRASESSADVGARWRAWERSKGSNEYHTTGIAGSTGEWHHAKGVFNVNIDTRELDKLFAAMKLFDLKRRDFIMVAALNRGSDRMRTQIKNMLAQKTGIKVKGRVVRGFRPIRASAGNWAAGLEVDDRYTRITPQYYGAKWDRSMPGVMHAAWNNPQTARGSFLAPSKAGDDGSTKLAFKRIDMSDPRSKLHVLFGPNMAREVERNAPAVDHIATAIANWWVVPEALRLVEVEWARLGKAAWAGK